MPVYAVEMRRGLIIAMLTLAVLPACTAVAQAKTQAVGIQEFFFRGDRVRIDPGDTVTWTNRGDVLHTVTSRRGAPQKFNSGFLDAGQVFSRAFTRPGTYDYLCTLHSSEMFGVVQVGPDRVKPVIGGVKARAGKSVRVAFRLSETSKVVARITRRGKLVRVLSKSRVTAGSRALTGSRSLAAGSYRVTVRATDLEGNKAKPATAKLTVR